jgi:Tfp pilus assembly protein PilO
MTAKRMNLTLKIGLALILVGIAAGLYFANKKLTTLAKQTTELKAKVEIGEQQIKSYEVTKAKVGNLSYVDELAAQVLPAQEDQSTVVAELTQFGRQTGLTISRIEFLEAGKSPTGKKLATPAGVNVTPVNINIAAGGSYSDLLNYLKLLETNRRRSQVSNINIAPDNENPNRLSEVTISLNLYTKEASTK